MIRILMTLALLTLMAGSVAACNTTAGAGQDISNTGNAISNSAQKLTP